MLTSLLLVIAGSINLMYTNSYNIAFAGLIVTGIGLAAGFPVILGYIGQLYAHLSGTAFSIALVIALTGNTTINYFFGFIADNYSTNYLPVLIIACVICMIILLFLIKQKIADKIKL